MLRFGKNLAEPFEFGGIAGNRTGAVRFHHADRFGTITSRFITAAQRLGLAFGHGPLPAGSELEVRSGPLADELGALASEGVQSLLLEGGPTLARAFIEADLVDKLLMFVAPKLAGGGPEALAARLASPRPLSHLSARAVGDDVLLEAYVHEL